MARIADLLAAGRTLSIELFPPKTDAGWLGLGRTITELEPLGPSFVSVTYGAGGSTRERTHDLVTWIRRSTAITPMAHLTCTGHTRAEIEAICNDYAQAGIENLLALGGDPPKDAADARPSDYAYAVELVEQLRSLGSFSIGVAAHPELHPRSTDRVSDRRHLATKLELADFAVCQFFFEAVHYRRLVAELAELGCTKPVLPGIMPVTNLASVRRMAELSGAEVPAWLQERLAAAGDDPAAVRAEGVAAATDLCRELLDGGVPGLHFYALNQSTATREIWAALGLSPAAA